MKRTTVRTTHEHAAAVAAALEPDNTTEMETTVDGERVETTIARETTGGLQLRGRLRAEPDSSGRDDHRHNIQQ